MVAAWEELCLTMRVSAGFVKLRVAALKELLQAGVNFGDEGGQCSARIKSVNLTVTASWEELCLTMQCTLLLFFSVEFCLTTQVNNAVQASSSSEMLQLWGNLSDNAVQA